MLRFLLMAVLANVSGCLSLGQNLSSVPTKIRNVVYRTQASIPVADKSEATRRLRNSLNNSHTPCSMEEVRGGATEYARALLQDWGFWKASIKTELKVLPAVGRVRWVDVVLRIEEGPQYTLSGITWTGMKEFTDAELQQSMSIHSGEVASRGRIGKGLQALNALYAARGYINFTAIPDTEFDDQAHTLAVRIEIDEGSQFYFGDLSLPGLDEQHREMLLQRWQSIRGTMYSFEKVQTFFRGVLWPADPKLRSDDYLFWSEFIDMRRDEKERTVNFTISFVAPPPSAISH